MSQSRFSLLTVLSVALIVCLLSLALPQQVAFAEELPAPVSQPVSVESSAPLTFAPCNAWCMRWNGTLTAGLPVILVAVATAASLPADAVFVAILAAGATAYAVVQRSPYAGETKIRVFNGTADINAWAKKTCPSCYAAMNGGGAKTVPNTATRPNTTTAPNPAPNGNKNPCPNLPGAPQAPNAHAVSGHGVDATTAFNLLRQGAQVIYSFPSGGVPWAVLKSTKMIGGQFGVQVFSWNDGWVQNSTYLTSKLSWPFNVQAQYKPPSNGCK